MEKLLKELKATNWDLAKLELTNEQVRLALYLDLLLLEMEAEMEVSANGI